MSHKTLRMMLLSALFAALTAVGAFIRLPAGPTSITLHPDAETEQLVKAADKLSAYIKCVEELKAGNNEFREAAAQTRTALEDYGLPEAAYFLETFLPSFSLTLDELK